MSANAPLRPRQHRIGDAAVRAFLDALPDHWSENAAQKDYGWDFIITLASATTDEVQDEFFAQVKGAEEIEYSADHSFVTRVLKTPTLKWLNRRPIPVLIAVCDVGADASGRPVYWVWLTDALKELEARNASWRTQETVTLRIPTNQLLRSDTAHIEAFVAKWHKDRRLDAAMADVLLPAHARDALGSVTDASEVDERYVRMAVVPVVVQHLAISIPASGPPNADPRRHRLERAAALLNVFHDDAAIPLLASVATELTDADHELNAIHENLNGLVEMHGGRYGTAAGHFHAAAVAWPSEPKYAVNALVAEDLTRNDDDGPRPQHWHDRLASLRRAHPKFVPALVLQMRVVGAASGLSAAAGLVDLAGVTDVRERRRLLVALADVAASQHAFDEALAYLAEAETYPAGVDGEPEVLSLKGYIWFRKALRSTGTTEPISRFQGYGPSDLDLAALRRAATAYDDACTALAKLGYPRVGEDTFYNAASVLVLAQQSDDADRHLRAFLRQHPTSVPIRAALALVLTHSDSSTAAVPYAREAFQASGESAVFKNFVLTLLQAEEFEELLDCVQQREQRGFADENERIFALEMAALAQAAVGRPTDAMAALQQLRDLGHHAEAAGATVFIAMRSGADASEIVALARQARVAHPDHPLVLTVLVRALCPPRDDTADEIIAAVTALEHHRQLGPDEAIALGRAYLVERRFAEAEQAFRVARDRFPRDLDLIADHAQALYELGRDEDSYAALDEFLRAGRRAYVVYRNLGQLAWGTGRTDEAIRLFESALSKATAPADRAELSCQLFELYRRQGRAGKAQLQHVVRYGATAEKTPEHEARYLMMFMVTPATDTEREDPDVQAWVADFQRRLSAFSEAYPRFHGLQSIKVPEGATEEERARNLLSSLMAVVLPMQMTRGQVEIRMREGAWPLAFRAERLHTGSVFAYWDHCVRSTDHVNAVHIFTAPLTIEEDMQAVPVGGGICIDVTALLTLHTLGLLDEVAGVFSFLVISVSTREDLEHEAFGLAGSHPVAVGKRDWLIAHRDRVRTRRAAARRRSHHRRQDPYQLRDGVWHQAESTYADLIGAGVGETLLLAAELNLPLYSDEAVIRLWAKEDGVPAFSTLGVLRMLRLRGNVSLENETKLLAKMLGLNFRYLAFGPEHVHEAVRLAIRALPDREPAEVLNHPDLDVLLLQFGDRALLISSLMGVASESLIKLLNDDDVPDDVIAELLVTVSFRLQQHRTGTTTYEHGDAPAPTFYAVLWSGLLFLCYREEKARLVRCWSVIRRAAERTYWHDEPAYKDVLSSKMPQFLCHWIGKLAHSDVADALIAIPGGIGDAEQQATWEPVLLKCAKKKGIIR